ncbi:MAG: DNA-directed RNA polymerase subunit H [Methanobacteriaceae archaeon]|nr:DNA-directed RNA polymerase subunit H [Methanobacteriaceae archaeon]
MKTDILKHHFVPEHTILSEEEVSKVLKEADVRLDQLPKILPDDPVVKAIGAEEGDVIKLNRESRTAGEFISYRIVRE